MPKVPNYRQPKKPKKLSHIETTAMAWGVTPKELRKVWGWLEEYVPPHQRSRALTTILRRKYKA